MHVSHWLLQLALATADAVARNARLQELQHDNEEKAEALANLQLVISAAEAGVYINEAGM